MPLRLLNRYLKNVPGFDASVSTLAQFCPAIFVVVGMMVRGLVLLHPRDTFNDYPSAYRVFLAQSWTNEVTMGWLEFIGGFALFLGGIYVRRSQSLKLERQSETSNTVLRWLQFGFFLSMIIGGGLGGMMLVSDALNPAWSWFFLRSFLAGVVVLQLCSEIEYSEGRDRRSLERRFSVPVRDQLKDLSDEQLKHRYLQSSQQGVSVVSEAAQVQ